MTWLSFKRQTVVTWATGFLHRVSASNLFIPSKDSISSVFCSIQFSSLAQSCLTLCDPMNRSTPGLPVHHQLPESTQTHVHRVGDDIQPSLPLSSPSPPAFNLSQHQGLFKCQLFSSGGQSTGVSASTSFLPMNIQDWFPLGWTGCQASTVHELWTSRCSSWI